MRFKAPLIPAQKRITLEGTKDLPAPFKNQ